MSLSLHVPPDRPNHRLMLLAFVLVREFHIDVDKVLKLRFVLNIFDRLANILSQILEFSVNFAANLYEMLTKGVKNLVKAVPKRLIDSKVSAEDQDLLLDNGLNLRDVGCLQKLKDLNALKVGILAWHLKSTN